MATAAATQPRQLRSDDVLTALRQYIIAHQLAPGDRLPGEAELARAVGVSRNVVREGLKALHLAGVITRRPRVGTTLMTLDLAKASRAVTLPVQPSSSDLADLCFARQFLELAFLPLIVAWAGPEDFRRMEEATLQHAADLSAGRDGVAADEAFHRSLFEAVGNRHLAQVGDLVHRYFTSAHELITREPMTGEEQQRTVEEHRRIVQALRRGDCATAQAIMARHLEGSQVPPENTPTEPTTHSGLEVSR